MRAKPDLRLVFAVAALGVSLVGPAGYGSPLSPHTSASEAPASFGVNVIDYGADPTGKIDSTQAFKVALAAVHRGTVFVPEGTYKLSAEIEIPNSVSLTGPAVLEAAQLDFQEQTSGYAAITIRGTYTGVIEGVTIVNAYNHGIAIVESTPGASDNRVFCRLSDIEVQHSGGDGFRFSNSWGMTLERLWSRNNHGAGFNFQGYHTSISATNLHASKNSYGFGITNMTYSSFTACAADSNETWGYQIANSHSITLNGCGAEGNGYSAVELVSSDAWAKTAVGKGERKDIRGVTINSFFSLGNATKDTSMAEFLRINSNDGRVIQGEARYCNSQSGNGRPSTQGFGNNQFTVVGLMN